MIQHSAANKVEVHFHCVIYYNRVHVLDIFSKRRCENQVDGKFFQRIIVMYHDLETPLEKSDYRPDLIMKYHQPLV